MNDIGIKRICVSVSDLEKSLEFFTKQMELTEVCRGRLDKQTVKAVYGLESSEAEYAMLKMMSSRRCCSLYVLPTRPSGEYVKADPAGIMAIMTLRSAPRTTPGHTTTSGNWALTTIALRPGMLPTGSTLMCWREYSRGRTQCRWR